MNLISFRTDNILEFYMFAAIFDKQVGDWLLVGKQRLPVNPLSLYLQHMYQSLLPDETLY